MKHIILTLIFLILLMNFISAVDEEKICKDIYYSVLKVGYDYEKISQLDYPQEEINKYYFNHTEFCVDTGFIREFPERNYSLLIIEEVPFVDCDFKEGIILALKIPFFRKDLDLECNSLERINYLFSISHDDTFYIDGIRGWWILLLVSFYISFMILRLRGLNREIETEEN